MNVGGPSNLSANLPMAAMAGLAQGAGHISGGGTAKVINSAASDGQQTLNAGVKEVSQQREEVGKGLYTPEGKAQALATVRQGNLIGAA
ncbi:hypothetical protein [Endothiovibrio diazotrophicus]